MKIFLIFLIQIKQNKLLVNNNNHNKISNHLFNLYSKICQNNKPNNKNNKAGKMILPILMTFFMEINKKLSLLVLNKKKLVSL